MLFVDRLPSTDLLQPALDAVLPTPNDSDNLTASAAAQPPADGGSGWPEFAARYCSAWAQSAQDPSTDMSYSAIRAMTRSVNEAHTRFLTPQMYRDHQAWAAGDVHYDGIGARLHGNPLGVQYVFPGGPAEAAGLLFGDDIVAIDGEPVTDLPAAEAVGLVRGETGTTVRLTVRRPGVAAAWDVDVARASVKLPVIESRSIGEVAYVHLQGFPTTDLPGEMRQSLLNFERSGARALVLDLRGNAGGRLDVGTEIASFFLPQETPVYQQTTRRGQIGTRVTSGERIWSRPMVVLVDEVTASMGEILAAALQEEKAATIVGSPTAGSVAGSIVVPLMDGSALQVTTLRITSGKGTPLNSIGVVPDVTVETTVADAQAGRDTVLDAGLGLLRSKLADEPPMRAANAPAAAAEQSAGAAQPAP
jgi:carboxyl-terminal processing protease